MFIEQLVTQKFKMNNLNKKINKNRLIYLCLELGKWEEEVQNVYTKGWAKIGVDYIVARAVQNMHLISVQN